MPSWIRSPSRLTSTVLLSLAGMFLAYSWIHTAILLDDARLELKIQRRRAEVLRSLLREGTSSWTRTDVVRLVRKGFQKEYLVKLEPKRIMVDDVVFKFQNGKLVSVLFVEEENGPPSGSEHRP